MSLAEGQRVDCRRFERMWPIKIREPIVRVGIVRVLVEHAAELVAPAGRVHIILQPRPCVSEFGRQAIAERFMKQALDRLIVRNAFVQTGTGTARANANARILRKWPAQVRRRR